MESPAVELLRRYKYFLWALYFALCLYCFIDVYQTKMLFDVGHYEVNPFLRWLINVTGTWWSIFAVKYIMLVFGGYWVNRYQTVYNKAVSQLERT